MLKWQWCRDWYKVELIFNRLIKHRAQFLPNTISVRHTKLPWQLVYWMRVWYYSTSYYNSLPILQSNDHIILDSFIIRRKPGNISCLKLLCHILIIIPILTCNIFWSIITIHELYMSVAIHKQENATSYYQSKIKKICIYLVDVRFVQLIVHESIPHFLSKFNNMTLSIKFRVLLVEFYLCEWEEALLYLYLHFQEHQCNQVSSWHKVTVFCWCWPSSWCPFNMTISSELQRSHRCSGDTQMWPPERSFCDLDACSKSGYLARMK